MFRDYLFPKLCNYPSNMVNRPKRLPCTKHVHSDKFWIEGFKQMEGE